MPRYIYYIDPVISSFHLSVLGTETRNISKSFVTLFKMSELNMLPVVTQSHWNSDERTKFILKLVTVLANHHLCQILNTSSKYLFHYGVSIRARLTLLDIAHTEPTKPSEFLSSSTPSLHLFLHPIFSSFSFSPFTFQCISFPFFLLFKKNYSFTVNQMQSSKSRFN